MWWIIGGFVAIVGFTGYSCLVVSSKSRTSEEIRIEDEIQLGIRDEGGYLKKEFSQKSK